MALPARAAAVRGDDFQYLRAWEWTLMLLRDPSIESVAVEDPEGGSFDDIVVRWTDGRIRFEQAKSSNYAEGVFSFETLTISRPKGKSLLQHLFETWRTNRGPGRYFALVTNRSLDAAEPILATRDNLSGKINVNNIRSAGPGSRLTAQLEKWVSHVGCATDDLLEFLTDLEIITIGTDAPRHVRNLQLLVGLRGTADALEAGLSMPRQWVKEGAGTQDRSSIKKQVVDLGLLLRDGSIRFNVYEIDKRASDGIANVEVDLREHFDLTVDPRKRHIPISPGALHEQILPRIKAGVLELEEFSVKQVQVGGSMRLPYWYTVGRLLSEVRGWRLSTEQTGQLWEMSPRNAAHVEVFDNELEAGGEAGVIVCLTRDARDAARVKLAEMGISSILAIGGDQGIGVQAAPNAEWMSEWARGAKEVLEDLLTDVPRVHLFLAAPQSAALMLGHLWNQLPDVVTYEWIRDSKEYVEDLQL